MNRILVFLRNIGEKAREAHSFNQIVAFFVCFGLMFLMMVSLIFRPWSDRAVFFFPETKNGSISTEIRYLPASRGVDARLRLYVSELLLGPIHANFVPLYSRNTQIKDAFIRNRAAYIDLSSDALSPEKSTVPQEKAYILFKKNVCTNFRNLDKIYVYIDGIEVYPRNPFDPAGNKKR